jgi:hypothetical protein
LSHLYIKPIIFPRQARDKDRENSKSDALFRTEVLQLYHNCLQRPDISAAAKLNSEALSWEDFLRCEKENAPFAMPF